MWSLQHQRVRRRKASMWENDPWVYCPQRKGRPFTPLERGPDHLWAATWFFLFVFFCVELFSFPSIEPFICHLIRLPIHSPIRLPFGIRLRNVCITYLKHFLIKHTELSELDHLALKIKRDHAHDNNH